MPHHGRVSTWQKQHGLPMAEEKVELELHPRMSADEIVLVDYFLRRYTRWCMRTRRYAQAAGADVLCSRVRMMGLPQ